MKGSGTPLTKLGPHLRLVERRNSDGEFTLADVRGVNNLKQLMPTKVDVSKRDLTRFQVVEPGMFVFNHRTSRNGSKFSIAVNYGKAPVIVTEDYVVFSVDSHELDPLWLYMYFCRREFDRNVITNSWGSSTEFYNWSDLCDIELSLPRLEDQSRFARVYQSIVTNRDAQQRSLTNLQSACNAAIEQMKSEATAAPVGPHIRLSDQRNGSTLSLDAVRGISTSKALIPTKASMEGVSLTNYKVVAPREIAYVPDTSRRGEKISLAYNATEGPLLVSSISTVFSTDSNKLDANYLMLFLARPEFDRYARFNSWGSARETFDWDEMRAVEIPLPAIDTQEAVSDLFSAYREKLRIIRQLDRLLERICPILIKGSMDTLQELSMAS